jgi:hypothetical protein
MRFLKPLLFIGAVLLMVELSFRVYLFGVNSLNPLRMNSYTQIHDSGLTQAASVPAVYFELRPDSNSWYKGERFTTNSAGLRDTEYAKDKPADTFRVAVLGSSWTMGSGVLLENVWHSLLEQELNATNAKLNFEVISFGVDQYGLGEIVATLEHKVPAYDPDLVIIALTHYTPTVLWPEPPITYEPSARRNPFFNYYTARVIDLRLNLGLFPNSDTRRESVAGDGDFRRQLYRALQSFSTYNTTTGTPVAIVRLAYTGRWTIKNQTVGSLFDTLDDNLVYFDVLEQVRSQGHKPRQLRISNWDSHPNAMAHQLIAEAVRNSLIANELLPSADDQPVGPATNSARSSSAGP